MIIEIRMYNRHLCLYNFEIFPFYFLLFKIFPLMFKYSDKLVPVKLQLVIAIWWKRFFNRFVRIYISAAHKGWGEFMSCALTKSKLLSRKVSSNFY